MIQPSFFIYQIVPEAQLRIHRKYDVERKARHMCSNCSFSKLQQHQLIFGQKFYLKGSLVDRGPECSLEAECQALQSWVEQLTAESRSTSEGFGYHRTLFRWHGYQSRADNW